MLVASLFLEYNKKYYVGVKSDDTTVKGKKNESRI